MTRRILTPCPPKKHCAICEARLNEVFGSADHVGKYVHQAAEAGRRAAVYAGIGDEQRAASFAVRAASFANLVLGAPAEN